MYRFGLTVSEDQDVRARSDLYDKSRDSVVGANFGAGLIGQPTGPDIANDNLQPLAKLDTGMLAQTRIQTPNGPTAIFDLKIGAAILDPFGKQATIRSILIAPTTRKALRLRAPYFGLDQDLIVGTNHLVTMTSDAAEYLFGEETVSVPAWALRDNRRVLHHELSSQDRLRQLQLDRPTDITIGKCAVGSYEKLATPVAKILNDSEARSFAAEYRTGFFN